MLIYIPVWPEPVYCCFTRTTLFTELFTFLVSITSPSFVALHLPVSAIANILPEGVYSFYKNNIVYFNVYHKYVH